MKCYAYILECSDGTLYTGWTNDLARRVAAHNAGRGANYTRPRLPVRLAYFEEHPDKISAMRREYELKRLPRAKKLGLVSANPLTDFSYRKDKSA